MSNSNNNNNFIDVILMNTAIKSYMNISIKYFLVTKTALDNAILKKEEVDRGVGN